MRIIGVEGSSFAGKTTLVSDLSRHLDAPTIEEYASYAQPEGFPSYAATKSELEDQIQYYVSLEAKRARDLLDVDDSAATVIVDRTAASLIAFQKVMSEDISGRGFSWDADSMQKAILRQREAGLVIYPDVTLVLTAGTQEEHERRVLERGLIATIASLNNWDFSEKIKLRTTESLRQLGSLAVIEYLSVASTDSIINDINDLIDKDLK
jgi:thymidylate kinase